MTKFVIVTLFVFSFQLILTLLALSLDGCKNRVAKAIDAIISFTFIVWGLIVL